MKDHMWFFFFFTIIKLSGWIGHLKMQNFSLLWMCASLFSIIEENMDEIFYI